MREIRSPEDYNREFPAHPDDDGPRAKALDYALDIRKFEIDLYWKRAGYFWTLIAASFAGLVALQTAKEPRLGLSFLVSCIGLVLSLGWYLVNRGSKYWQENWERHVDALETEVIGPLYKTTLSKQEFPWIKLWGGYPYSVSNVNQLISLFIALVWACLALASFPALASALASVPCAATLSQWALAVVTIVFLLLLCLVGRSRSEGTPRRINFRISPLEPTGRRDV